MYVDKRLAGIQAVQTLSRLNRIHPLKEDTFVLDFVNDREEIREAFKTYYEGAEMGEEVDPARMYAIKGELDASGIYLDEEVERFCAVYFKPKQRQSAHGPSGDERGARSGGVAVHRAARRTTRKRRSCGAARCRRFCNLYGFLSQVIPYQDSDLERLYVFLRHLAAKLPRRRSGPAYQFDDEVRLEYYRLQKISEGSISLQDGEARPPRWPHRSRQRPGAGAAGAAVAAHRRRERALRHGLQPGRPALLRPDRRGGDGRRRAAAGGRRESGRQVRAGVQEPAGDAVRRAHGSERGDLRAVHERRALPEDRDGVDGVGGVSAAA